MPTTPMALLSALDRNGLRNPDYFRSSTYLFTSNLPLVSTSTSKWYRPTMIPLPYLSGLAQQCLINRFLPSILSPLYATFQFQDLRISPYLLFSSVTYILDLKVNNCARFLFSILLIRLKFYLRPKYTSNN